MRNFTDMETFEPRIKEKGGITVKIKWEMFQSKETESAKDSNEKHIWVC